MASGVQEIDRQELQSAIAKAVELRALHAALTRGSNSSPASLRLPPGALPCVTRMFGEDYPVFTPSYDDDPFPGYPYLRSENRTLSETWRGSALEGEIREGGDINLLTSKIDRKYSSIRRNQQVSLADDQKSSISQQVSLADDQKSSISSCLNHIAAIPHSPGADVLKSIRRTGPTDLKSVETCNKCKPASINRESDADSRSHQDVVAQLPPKARSPIFSWLFPQSKKKPKSGMSPNTLESEDVMRLFKDWGVQTFESLKKELKEAKERRDEALAEAGEMRSAMEELKDKMIQLEFHCDELKNALKQALQVKEPSERRNLSSRRKNSIDGSRDDNSMPVSNEVMVEGFLQMVSESRLSIKHFCKVLLNQIDEHDDELLIEKINLLLRPYNLTVDSRGVMYHLEAIISQSLYQDFENCVFQRNGPPKTLDPHRGQHENFSAFASLRNLSWNEVLRKGTKYHSEDFSRFCDLKMSSIVSLLDWSRPWPENLLHSFFVSAKCIWLLHLLAFSFDPPLPILRVEENRSFDALYMEDILLERHRGNKLPLKVKIMVMPGFYVQDRVLKCKVLSRYRS